ncbi:hypothetical protein FAIPA1_580001 [Frankia sp. AiPs1]
MFRPNHFRRFMSVLPPEGVRGTDLLTHPHGQ